MNSEANLRLRTHDDYTVGWVCALPKEQTAAIAMLDHRHADLQKPPNDQNAYTFGSISSHNIVIACLPKGKTGTNSAATVAAWMVSTFPSIKVGLLVGIGGGVPPKVRLGDVVVSTPTGQFPGVVQWDIDLDCHVLYIEMEAAGLMNNFPCIVIRGIYGYADSHTNNVWQEHAAATAAAFAKELLGYVQTSDVEREPPAKDLLEKVFGTISAVEENTAHTRAKLESIENIKILDWLTPTDYGLRQSDYFQRWQPGTGRWFLNSKVFQNWMATINQTLFCQCMPGAGKPILTSVVVDYLTSEFRRGDTGIAYIYCDFRRHDEQTTANLLASILKQLAGTQPLLPNRVKISMTHIRADGRDHR
ncbi:hypothetical protein THAR02_10996 [Trichoderma harzianum]|uniref:Uncharacterized protein n=1 Tax=Trichoderma harzianum TaxID=5544 RepID=A0A0F9ZUT9_TRIHA|nr:hypothetical protein THAR02_10996 [Trichoderma harzianum]